MLFMTITIFSLLAVRAQFHKLKIQTIGSLQAYKVNRPDAVITFNCFANSLYEKNKEESVYSVCTSSIKFNSLLFIEHHFTTTVISGHFTLRETQIFPLSQHLATVGRVKFHFNRKKWLDVQTQGESGCLLRLVGEGTRKADRMRGRGWER